MTGQDLWAEWQRVPPNEFRLLVEGRTRGVFPASIGVTRVHPLPDGSEDRDKLILDMKPAVDFLRWNSAFDDLRSISEVFPIEQMALNGAQPSIDSILAAGDALRAELCLIYAEVPEGPAQAEVSGVLFEVHDRRPLAAIRSLAAVADPIDGDETVSHPDEKSTVAREQRDPRLVSEQYFEALMRKCLLALMHNDDPAERVAPEGWVPERMLEPAIWPPAYDWPFPRRP